MELPHVGKQCSIPECKQLDFLPFECSECKSIYCRLHYNQHMETCLNNETNLNTQNESSNNTVYVCSQFDCNEKSFVALLCEKCDRHFCIKHRHISNCDENATANTQLQVHITRENATRTQFDEAKCVVDKVIEKKLKKAKDKETAQKVQLIRLKSKATGLKTIPTLNRIYLSIFCEKHPESRAIYVSNEWTIGRCIDAIATELNVSNNNNKLTAPKLRLFRHSDGLLLTNQMSDTLDMYIQNETVVNGDLLRLDYIM